MGSPYSESTPTEAMTSEDEYVSTLSAEAVKMTARDFHEDDANRSAGLAHLRAFVRSGSPISRCRVDCNFLLRFLRMKKFDRDEAANLLHKYVVMRVTHPHWFSQLDVKDPRIESLVDRGYFFALPERDDSGRRVFFSVAGTIDPNIDTTSDIMRTMQLGFESLLEDEENHVRGFSYVFDEGNLSLGAVLMWSPSDVGKVFQCCEKTIPMRHKEINFVNLPMTLHIFFEFAKTLLSEKIRNRFQVHSDASRLRQKVPVKILPFEYGGTVPMSQMIKMYKKELLSVRSRVLLLDNCQTSKKVSTSKVRKVTKVLDSLQKNFRRLDID